MHDISPRHNGFTLVEVLVALAISSLALIMLTRLLSVSLNSYNLQEQVTDMNQNARYTIREIGEVLMQAGADLQIINTGSIDRDTIIIPDGNKAVCSGFTMKVNPFGGWHQIPQAIATSICSVKVDNARKFRQAGVLQRVPANTLINTLTYHTITNIDTAENFILFEPATTFARNDILCSFAFRRYYLSGTNLCMNSDATIIAENIDSLSIVFEKEDGMPTTNWQEMRAVNVLVRTKTALPDNRYNEYIDHCRRITLTYRFRLRNKVEM